MGVATLVGLAPLVAAGIAGTLLLAGLVALGAAIVTTPVGEEWATAIWSALEELVDTIRGLLT